MTNGSGIRQLSLGGHVGFDSLPDQLVNQAVTTGFTFNIMCVGETGLGMLFVYYSTGQKNSWSQINQFHEIFFGQILFFAISKMAK